MRKPLLALSLLVSAAAHAHDADVIYALTESRDGVLFETVTMTGATLLQLAPADADADRELTQSDLDASAAALNAGLWQQMPLTANGARCERSNQRARLREGFVELSAQQRCPGDVEAELRYDFRFLSVLPTNYRVVLGSQLGGERSSSFAQGTLTSLTFQRPRPTGVLSAAQLTGSVQEGLARCFTLDAFAAIVLAFFIATSWRQAAIALAIGTLSSVVGLREPWPAAVLSLGGVAVVVSEFAQPKALRASAIALIGIGLGIRGGGGSPSDMVGLFIGTALGLTLVGAPAALIARIVQRRPRVLHAVSFVLLAAMVFRLVALHRL